MGSIPLLLWNRSEIALISSYPIPTATNPGHLIKTNPINKINNW